MDNLANDPGNYVLAGVATLGAVGAGIKWLFSTQLTRQKLVDAAVTRFYDKLERRLEEAEAQVLHLTQACHILIAELSKELPDSPAIQKAQDLLDKGLAHN